MVKYSLRFAANNEKGEQTLSFFAHSMGGALDTAKRAAEGDWAELFAEDKLLYRLQLIERTGVWLVTPQNSKAES